MKKRIVTIVALGLMVPTVVFGQDIKLVINNQEVKTQIAPMKKDGTTIVPLKVIATELGAKVDFDSKGQKVTIVKNNKVIELPIGKNVAMVNGEQFELRTPATIINGTTMLPVRFVSDHLDCSTGWDYKNNTVIITPNEIIGSEEENKEAKVDNKNIYTSEFLQKLVDTTPCNEDVLEFRKQDNPRRDGLLKQEGKYFDIYYPSNDSYAQKVANTLKLHMDKAYMMLADLYGIQAKVEVHLIDGEIGSSLMSEEGDVRQKENITFVWLEEGGNDDATENQNITELIHEINHNFFDQTNGKRNYTLWIDEANSKLIPSLYKTYNYTAKNSYEDFNNIKVMYNNIFENMDISGNKLTINDVNMYMSRGDAWSAKNSKSKEGIAYDYAIVLWNYVYNQCPDLETFKYYLRNMSIGKDDALLTLEKLLQKDINEIEKDFLNYIS